MSRSAQWNGDLFFSQKLSDTELLAYFLSEKEKKGDGLDQATKLIKTFGSIDEVLKSSPYRMLQVPSLTKETVCRLTRLRELNQRLYGKKLGGVLDAPNKVFEISKSDFIGTSGESCLVLGRSKDKKMVLKTFVAFGDTSMVSCSVKELFKPLLIHDVDEMIVLHNHLDHLVAPSRADLIATNRILEAAQILEVTLIDHLIVHERSYLSFYELGYLPIRECY
jgi:DNA repair protein RadC